MYGFDYFLKSSVELFLDNFYHQLLSRGLIDWKIFLGVLKKLIFSRFIFSYDWLSPSRSQSKTWYYSRCLSLTNYPFSSLRRNPSSPDTPNFFQSDTPRHSDSLFCVISNCNSSLKHRGRSRQFFSRWWTLDSKSDWFSSLRPKFDRSKKPKDSS